MKLSVIVCRRKDLGLIRLGFIAYCRIDIPTILPVVSEIKIFSHRMHINRCNEQQIKTHTQISECQIAHEKFRNGDITPVDGQVKLFPLRYDELQRAYQFENRTINTEKLPNTARNSTIHTDTRSHWEPITSSHGFNASGMG